MRRYSMKTSRYSLREIIASLPKEKVSADSYWTRFVLRPLSFPVAWLCLALGLSPNVVSYLSALIAVAGGALLATGKLSLAWVGIALLFLFSVLDCVDGNMARTLKKPNPWGSWADAVGGYLAYTSALLGLGMAAEVLSPSAFPLLPGVSLPWEHGTWAFLGGFAAAANMAMRAIVQSRRTVLLSLIKNQSAKQENPGTEKWLSENLGVTGLLVPAYAVGLGTGTLPWILLFYTALYGLGAVFVVSKLILATLKEEGN
jgi:phosphatidylglycerophosphate synthase